MKRLLAILLLALACSKERPAKVEAPNPTTPAPPTALEARELIANSAEFGEHQFTDAAWTTPIRPGTASAPVRAEAQQLADAGWIELDTRIGLTDKSRNDKRFLMRANGLLDVVPIAKKEMGDVTAVRNTEVDFAWKWIPNDVGAVFKNGPTHDRLAAPHASTATLIWDGTTWSVLKIDARPGS